ncbi:hypothetical protein B7494_g342 [Chlorociboria aeruginascens]|nr:hypothetical protein B7494_g342 [Chlorociboria aeruginascens]
MVNKPKSVLITGCSSGIGNALALEFFSKGLRVFSASRSIESMRSLAEVGIETIQLDPTSSESIRLARDEIAKKTGGTLDILVNNAGQWLEYPAIETELDLIKAMFDVNVFAVMEMVKQFSMVRNMPYPMTAAYNASEAAVAQYSNTLRLELEPMGVRVIELVTGQVATGLIVAPTLGDTSIYKSLQSVLQNRAKGTETAQKPDVFARAVVKNILSTSPSREIYKGNLATVSWILSTFGPSWAFDPLMRSITGLGKFKSEISARAISASKHQ